MTPAREPVRRLREAAEAVLAELDIIRDANPRGGPNVVHIDTHRDLRAALASPSAALDGFAEENGGAGSRAGLNHRATGLTPDRDASDDLELRDASSASPPTAEPLPDALDVTKRLNAALNHLGAMIVKDSWPDGLEPVSTPLLAAEFVRETAAGRAVSEERLREALAAAAERILALPVEDGRDKGSWLAAIHAAAAAALASTDGQP